MKPIGFIVLITAAVISYLPAVRAADWDSCADDLDRLHRAARDAAEKANEVKEKSEEVESKRNALENCKHYPDMYDLLRDGCRSKVFDYRSAMSDYESAANDLHSELDTVDSRIRSVRSSCDYQLGGTSLLLPRPAAPPKNPYCALYRSYKGKLPLDLLVKRCIESQAMSEAACRKCLAD